MYTCAIIKFLFVASGSMIANSSIAVVNITELECGTDYTIIAGGVMSNGTLAGPRLILGKCPKISCVFIQSSGKKLIYGYSCYAYVH